MPSRPRMPSTPARPRSRERYLLGADLLLDVGRQRLERAGSAIELPKLSFEFLLVLARGAPDVVTYDELMAQVWPGLVVQSDTITQRAKLLRDALGDSERSSRLIRGVRGRGYTLSCAVIPYISDDAATHQLPQPADPISVPSIAVLPFHNMSGDVHQEYFADGVSEDIITALSRFHELVVISRSSSFSFKGKGLDHRQIAQQLGVQYVLSGSMRKVGNRIRVSAELTDTGSSVQVWSDRYDRNLADVFELQDEISRTVAAVVAPAVRGAEIERARRKPPASLSAYDLYLRALPHMWAMTREDIPKAIELLRRSLSLDPTHAAALATLALCLRWASPVGAGGSPEMATEAVALARRAIEQDGADAFAQAVYGLTLFGHSRDYAQVCLHASEAVRLNPSSAFAWGTLGMMNSMGGDFEAGITELNRALSLSPFDSLLFIWTASLATACFALGRHEEGVIWARKAVQQNPGYGTAHRLLAANLASTGRLEEAREVSRKRDSAQKTTIRELRSMRLFSQDEVLERYLAAQRMVGVAE